MKFAPGVLILLGILSLASCQQSQTHQGPDRPHSPWFFRSVLDEKPRMLTLALHEELWAAYHTQTGALYKVWRGDVNLDGAVYTTRHGPQPTSRGATYLENPLTSAWEIKKGDTPQKYTYQYFGHKLENGQIRLIHQLILADGSEIEISEGPEFIQDAEGNPGLERSFMARNVPEGLDITLPLQISNTLPKGGLDVQGDFTTVEEKKRNAQGQDVLDISGLLHIKANQMAIVRSYFKSDALSYIQENKALALSPEAIIEQSDCRSCHNETEKTIGPAYVTIAKKYDNTFKNVEYLSNKILNGGAGVWGETAMNAHPNLDYAQAEMLAKYVLALDKEELTNEMEGLPNQGVVVHVYQFFETLEALPKPKADQKPVKSEVKDRALINHNFVKPLQDNFLTVVKGKLHIPRTGTYTFLTRNNYGGSDFVLDNKKVIDFDGWHEGGWAGSPEAELSLEAGVYPFTMRYFRGTGNPPNSGDSWFGVLRWKAPGDERFDNVPKELFSYESKDLITETEELVVTYRGQRIPGDQFPLEAVHPSFDLKQARPDSFQPKVAGMDFLSDGRLVVSTWDSTGSVYILSGLDQDDPEKIQVKLFAQGLAEPLGLKVVEDEIYVLQKQELTQLIDENGDQVADTYQNICNNWKVSANFHEFAFGLAFQEGYFYGALATAILPGGASANPQIVDRGKIFKINRKTGDIDFLAHGMRTPNGIGIGVDQQIFNADNQGDWLPASKVVHVQEGAFYGSRSVDFAGTADLKPTLPVVWMPQDEIGNSPAQIGLLNDGPYAGQMIVAEVTHGGLKRIYPEKINGAYQGALFRFTQGMEAGINRFAYGPDGALYLGGIGVNGNWGHYVEGKMGQFALQKISYNGQSTFEMLHVSARSNGLEIEFTEALQVGEGGSPEDYLVKQWWYQPTQNYGGPKMDEEQLSITSVHLSDDRKKVFLEIEGMKAEHLLYLRILNHFVSVQDHELWSTECWYTMNNIPNNKPGFTKDSPNNLVDNTLSPDEIQEGWKLLFDGKSTDGWHSYGQKQAATTWQAQNGVLSFSPATSDINTDLLTHEQYENFELKLEWKISPGGNSGIMYRVQEREDAPGWFTGPEMQILDDAAHPDARYPKHRSGDLYDMIACRFVSVKPAGEWNKIRLRVQNNKVQHWQNGHLVVEYTIGDDSWNEIFTNSKFAEMADFAKKPKGHILLQDHGDKVYFKNIKIKAL